MDYALRSPRLMLRNNFLELSMAAPVEVEWQKDGSVDVRPMGAGIKIRVRAPGAADVRLNGSSVEFRRSGVWVEF